MREVWRHTDADGDLVKLTHEPAENPEEEFAMTARSRTPHRAPVAVLMGRQTLTELRDAITRELDGAGGAVMPESEEREPFGFKVTRHPNGRWSVSLPHQCARWDIAGEDDWERQAVPQHVALRQLRDFIREAQEAEAALLRGEAWEAR